AREGKLVMSVTQTGGKRTFPTELKLRCPLCAEFYGHTRASGAVGALYGFLHPVSVAYAVMARLPHVLLVGEGAARFAAEINAERDDLLTETMRENLARWKRHSGLEDGSRDLIQAVQRGMDPQQKDSTTVYLAQDADGNIAVATSTSGWAW